MLDGSKDTSDPNVSSKIDKDVQNKFLKRLFGTYLTDAKQCPQTSDDIDVALKRGQIVPSVVAVARGSFSGSGVDEKLYLVFIGECGATHAENFGRMMLVLTKDDDILAKDVIGGGSSMHSVLDLDRDGQNEFILISGFMNHGIMVQSASLQRFDGTRLFVVKDFETVLENSCASMFEEKSAAYSVVRAVVVPRTPPTFRIERKSTTCGE